MTVGKRRRLPAASSTHRPGPPLWVALFSGAAVLALEVSALRMFMLVATLSIFAPAAILVTVITSLAAAAGAYPAIANRWGRQAAPRIAVGALATAGVLTAIAPIAFMAIARQSNWFAANTSSSAFVLKLIALALVTVGPAWFAGGLVFPAAVAWSDASAPASHAGRRLGFLLAVNGVGGLLGAELAYRLLLPLFGIYGSISVIAIAMTLAGFALWATRPAATRRMQTGAVAAFAGLLVLITTWSFTIRLPVMNPPKGARAVDIRTGREGTVAVVEDQRDHRSIIVSNQYSLGGTSVRYDQERQLLLPLVLHEYPREVACIGLATGITAGRV